MGFLESALHRMWWTDHPLSSFRNLRRKVMTNDEKRKGRLDGSMLLMLAMLAITSESNNKNNAESFPLSAPSSSSSTFYIIYL